MSEDLLAPAVVIPPPAASLCSRRRCAIVPRATALAPLRALSLPAAEGIAPDIPPILLPPVSLSLPPPAHHTCITTCPSSPRFVACASICHPRSPLNCIPPANHLLACAPGAPPFRHSCIDTLRTASNPSPYNPPSPIQADLLPSWQTGRKRSKLQSEKANN